MLAVAPMQAPRRRLGTGSRPPDLRSGVRGSRLSLQSKWLQIIPPEFLAGFGSANGSGSQPEPVSFLAGRSGSRQVRRRAVELCLKLTRNEGPILSLRLVQRVESGHLDLHIDARFISKGSAFSRSRRWPTR